MVAVPDTQSQLDKWGAEAWGLGLHLLMRMMMVMLMMMPLHNTDDSTDRH